MPSRLPKACRQPYCSSTTTDKSGYCDKHRKVQSGWGRWQRDRGNRHQRGYGTAWDKLRAEILKRDNHLCQEHLRRGIPKQGRHVDHIISKANGGTDDPSNLQTLCKPCHEAKTSTERAGKG